ncbi:hypothetical protein FEM48_Zijuj05G0019400 [Ziziphus jujuba var. spinosa]|uniref:Leucine-rich repeat-containing N-terminal plant-type domain-containing protein n=1 Tax=Ziziphus jujuba var. spinosa TaxID=714518 RepID=A0A978VC51_ZIZJJ|nr:hypothetical protein FEM48_Zijuj05G0019400 [Ziziphus jujuba var. spinosa]
MNCMESDREALIDFKNGLHDPANRLSSWKGSNCCHWWGINCENTTGAVIAVDLRNPCPTYNYDDESLDSLRSLSFLGYLNLSNNEFSGPIPNNDHMLTSNASSFTRNVGLYGGPLTVKCPVMEGEKLDQIFKEKAKRFSMSTLFLWK